MWSKTLKGTAGGRVRQLYPVSCHAVLSPPPSSRNRLWHRAVWRTSAPFQYVPLHAVKVMFPNYCAYTQGCWPTSESAREAEVLQRDRLARAWQDKGELFAQTAGLVCTCSRGNMITRTYWGCFPIEDQWTVYFSVTMRRHKIFLFVRVFFCMCCFKSYIWARGRHPGFGERCSGNADYENMGPWCSV